VVVLILVGWPFSRLRGEKAAGPKDYKNPSFGPIAPWHEQARVTATGREQAHP